MQTPRPEYWIGRDEAATLCDLFAARVARTPDALAYRFYSPRRHEWISLSWAQVAARVQRWQAVLAVAGK